MSSYDKTVKGKLKLKGVGALSSKKIKSKKRTHSSHKDKEIKSNDSKSIEFELIKRIGTGRILSSGTTLMGQMGSTKFLEELSVGDALIVMHPTSLVEETRIVRMVLSDSSASISSGFSTDLITSTSFSYIKAPPDEDIEPSKNIKQDKIAYSTYEGGTEVGSTITYRVKKSGAYGGYAIIKEDANVNRSREDLLDLRAKKKGDRHCM